MKVIIIEDENIKLITLTDALRKHGYDVIPFNHPQPALDEFFASGADVVITDMRLPAISGTEIIKEIKEKSSETYVVVMTAYGTIEMAVDAMKSGAHDFVMKPFKSQEMIAVLDKIKRIIDLEQENKELKKKLYERYLFHNIVGKSKPMQDIYDIIETIADSDHTVLVEGESGTGKEMIANAIHYNSNRKDKPFVKVSCAALTESLLESELFGHTKGAFTGAIKDKKGRFELADSGTIFLDDIDDIPLTVQVKLLRVLEHKGFERVGGMESIDVNIRVICATKVDLLEHVREGKFREDLYYRLRVIPIRIPPLRERREDIPLLIDHFLKQNKTGIKLDNELLLKFAGYNWPGNVRQLYNAVSRIATFIKKPIVTNEDVPTDIFQPEVKGTEPGLIFQGADNFNLQNAVQNLERDAIQWALGKTGGNKKQAAELLGLKRSTFLDHLKKIGDTKEMFDS